MPPIDAQQPDDQQPEQPNAAETDTPETAVETPPETLPEDEGAAFERGYNEAAEEDAPAPERSAEPAEAGKEGEAATAEAAKADAQPVEQPADAGAEPDAAVEDEIKKLELKEAAAERFRELSKRPKDEDVAPLRERAERADQWEQTVAGTGATPEEFGAALGYLAALHADDPKSLQQAYDYISGEQAKLAKQLGKAAPGHDPLAEHTDLRDAVESGDMTEQYAHELAERRAAEARFNASRERQQATQTQQQAMERAVADVNTLNAELAQSDPQFKAKLERLAPTLNVIKDSVPPAQWAPAIRKLFAETVIEQPKPKPPVGAVPLRPTAAGTQTRKPKTDEEAFEMGVASVKG